MLCVLVLVGVRGSGWLTHTQGGGSHLRAVQGAEHLSLAGSSLCSRGAPVLVAGDRCCGSGSAALFRRWPGRPARVDS